MADHRKQAKEQFKLSKARKKAAVVEISKEPRLLRGIFPLLWISIAGFILFGQTIRFDYTYLDDQTLILNHMDKIGHLSYIPQTFNEDAFHTPSGKGFYYRPVLTTSFVIDAVLGGGKFILFHISNILFHILSTFLLFLLFMHLGFDRIRSFLFSMVFLVHPVVTQAVAWVPGRNDSLLTIFILVSFILYIKYQNKKSPVYFVLHLISYILALLTKETAFVFPALLFFFCFMMKKTTWKEITWQTATWVIITLGWLMIRYQVLGQSNGYTFAESLESMLGNLTALFPFFGKVLFPFRLSVFPILIDMKTSTILGFFTLLVLLVLFFSGNRKNWKSAVFYLLWFLLFLLPSFIKIKSQFPDFTEHRVYLSLAGILCFLLDSGPVRNINFRKPIPVIVFILLLIGFSGLTYAHSKNFKDKLSFWQNAVETSPSHAFNYNNLGAMCFLNGDMEKAEKLFRQAIAINPVEPLANGNIGLICMRTNRYGEAKKFYLEEIRINPTYDNVYFNLGILYYNQGFVEDALKLWEKTLEINPTYTDAYRNLLMIYEQMKRTNDLERIRIMALKNGCQ